MPIELQIIRAQEFIRLGAHGRFDLEASQAVLEQLAAACWKRGINQALLDLRSLHPGPKPVFSPTDLMVLVNTFRDIGFTPRQRLAVLYLADPHRRARLFASIAKQHGWSVQAFDNFEQAVLWLSAAGSEPVSPAEIALTSKPAKIPVRKHKPLPATAKLAAPPTIEIKTITRPQRDAVPVESGARKSPKATEPPAPRRAGPAPRRISSLLTPAATNA